ncbi:tRNA pseudouridine(13) synthase TruD [Candidatus Micrarchaeota archaeon]|nr:tRNA pseudouridine(13) synthase TruD [Candidatus Micrarchaeota archaeon]
MESSYLSNKEKAIKGRIKDNPSDFIVEEIGVDGKVFAMDEKITKENSGSQFVHFVLQKENWSTPDTAREIASRLHISPKRINYAGTKDKKAITVQLMSAFGVKKEAVLEIKILGMKILGAWNSTDKVEMGMLLGNRFKIRVDGEVDSAIVDVIAEELNVKFPNYFGPQRFGGTRNKTHRIGEMLLRHDLRGAVESYLMDYEGETNQYAIEARKKLKEEQDYQKAVDYFPKHLRMERLLLIHLAKNKYDYANALRKLPRPVLLLFVHAFQSYIFNVMVSERLGEGELSKEEGEYFCKEKFGFPDLDANSDSGWLVGKIIGYETVLNEREKELLERFDIMQKDFQMKSIPEINSKGTYRTLLAPMKDFEYNDNVFSFSLPSGSYATSVLREFIKDLW